MYLFNCLKILIYLCCSSNQNQDKFIKKSRQGRRNDKQSLFLIDYMVQHPHVASGKFNYLNGKDKLNGSWEELVK